MKFTMVGELYLTVDEARWYRARTNDAGEIRPGVYATLQTHHEFECDLVRGYPIEMSIRGYDVDLDSFRDALIDLELRPDSTPTCGILGGDGDLGWTPAINFACNAPGMFGTVYVVPWPETVRPITHGHPWQRVADAVIRYWS